MRERIGRKLILIGAVGLTIWLLFDMKNLTFSYSKVGIENIILYRWYTSLSDIIFKSRLFGIISAYLNNFYLIFLTLFLFTSKKRSSFIIKINGLFFIGFYIEFLPTLVSNTTEMIANAISGVMIIIGIILLETEWFTEGHRIENYGKAILTLSSWIMLIFSGIYAKRITTSIAINYSENGIHKSLDLVGYDVDIIWLLKFNFFMLLMCLLLLTVGKRILKRLKEDNTENILAGLIVIGIVLIFTGIYRGIKAYPEGYIRCLWLLHWFLGAFLITGGILNHIGIRLRNRKETVDLQER